MVRQTNGLVHLALTGTTTTGLRIKGSTNLATWTPLDLPSHVANDFVWFIDPAAPDFAVRFYRALIPQVLDETIRASKASGSPGDRIEITGLLPATQPPWKNVATIGGVEAKTVTGDDMRLVVEVPPGARSGPVTIRSQTNDVELLSLFMVTSASTVHLTVPAGLDARTYAVFNDYVMAVPADERD